MTVERTLPWPTFFANPQVYDEYPDEGIALVGVETHNGPGSDACGHFAIFAGDMFHTIYANGIPPNHYGVEIDFRLYAATTPAGVYYLYLKEEFGAVPPQRDCPLIGY